MLKVLVCVLLAALATPTLAARDTLHLPADVRIDVQVIDRVTLDQRSPDVANVLLHPAQREPSSATQQLPHYCLITADAQLEETRVRLTTRSVTCIEAEGEQRKIFSGTLSAAAFERDGGFGLDVCSGQNGQCTSATIGPDHTFQLSISRDTEINALTNPSEEINKRRRQANGKPPAPDDASEHSS